jgi:hypothetical protein
MIKTTYNPNESAYRQAELDYVKTHSASEQQQRQHDDNNNTTLRNFALVNKIGGREDVYQSLIEEGKNQNKQLAEFVIRSHQASEEQAKELKRSDKSQILRFYELVQSIGRRYG